MAEPHWKIREVVHGSQDYDAVIRLRYQVLREPIGKTYTSEQLAAEKDETHLSLWIDEQPVASLCLMSLEDDATYRLRQMAVHPDHQGRGYGAKLVRHAEEVARAHGKSHMMLLARVSALDFYKKLGYVEEGEVFIEMTLPHQRMRKTL